MYEVALVLFGVLIGAVCGTAYGIKETRRECEARMRIVRRYLTRDQV
jgi:hypothetical protein